MGIRVAITDLKPGMYIVDLEEKRGEDASIFSVEGYMLSEEEIPRLLQQGFTTAFVDPVRSRLLGPDPEPGRTLHEFDLLSPDDASPARATAYHDEYEHAQSLQNESNDIAELITTAVLSEADLPLPLIRSFLSGIVDSVTRNESVLLSLAKLNKLDDSICTHGLNVCILAVALGRQMRIKSQYIHDLALAGFLHDIGKFFVDKSVLDFRGKLSAERLREAQAHAARGHDFLKAHPVPQIVLDGALEHHERYGGTGYPGRKAGSAISFTGRLLAVADVYDALSSKRSYRNPLSPAQALSIMYSERQDYSPGFTETLISAVGVYPPGSLVSLSNHHLGVVIESNEAEPLRPKVVLLADGRGIRVRPKVANLHTMRTISITGLAMRAPANVDLEKAIRSAL